MRLTVRYLAQLRTAIGQSSEVVELPAHATAADLVALVAGRCAALRPLLLDESGRPQPTVLLFAADEQVGADFILRDDAEITLLTPIAGGSGVDG